MRTPVLGPISPGLGQLRRHHGSQEAKAHGGLRAPSWLSQWRDSLAGPAGSLASKNQAWGPHAPLLHVVYAGLRFPHCGRQWKRAWAPPQPRSISAGLCF